METSQSIGGSSKRSKINKEGEYYSSNSNPSTLLSRDHDVFPITHPSGVKARKKKDKQMHQTPLSSISNIEYAEIMVANETTTSQL